jgi:hypothetical protein
MSCAPLAFLLSASAVLTVAGFAADAEKREPATPERPAILAPPTSSDTTAPAASTAATPTPASRPRLVSPAVAAQLSVGVPKFEQPPAAAEKPAEPAQDLREIDKPRNTIVRLPRYLVQEDKPPVFKDRELMTPKARLHAALHKHPGLNLGSFWIFRNDGIAMAMLAEEERLERKREFEDMASLISSPREHANVKRHVEQAFLREADFGR